MIVGMHCIQKCVSFKRTKLLQFNKHKIIDEIVFKFFKFNKNIYTFTYILYTFMYFRPEKD